MNPHRLTRLQQAAADAGGASFLVGPAGVGKSTALSGRLARLLGGGESAYTLLVLVAEPEHVAPFEEALRQTSPGGHAELTVATYSRLARELVRLFWPLVARQAGFERASRPPTFLGYDLAQLLMWQTIAPLLAEGAFASLRLRPQQIVSQILDTLNRAALNGLRLEEALQRQLSTWAGEADQLRHFSQAADAANAFRQRCLSNNLLDLSLAVQVFDTHLVKHPEFRRYFSERYRHLIVDNIEEQTPAGQNFVAQLMPVAETSAIAFDAGGGYKRFLAADPAGARRFAGLCDHHFEFEESFTAGQALFALASQVEGHLLGDPQPAAGAQDAIHGLVQGRYRREMAYSLAEELLRRESAGLAPRDIAIIAPYLDGALLFTLGRALRGAGLPYTLLRRRATPRDEPRVRAWLTWLALAQPGWGHSPAPYDVAEALSLSVHGLDPARAQLLIQHLYQPAGPNLLDVDLLGPQLAGRIGADALALVAQLRAWLEANGNDQHPPDIFLNRLFHGLLSLPSFRPEPDPAGAAVCDWLVRTAAQLRRAAGPMGLQTNAEVGRALIQSLEEGLVSADPPDLGEPPDPDGVLVTTVYGYLLAGRPVALQVWLEPGASGWWDIPRQPLSNAFVLAQSWPAERPWTMEEDFNIRNELLSRIIRGLCSRCSGGVLLAHSELDRRGLRQEGPLWRALQPLLRPQPASA
ncbi:MAG: UvrD-helicase domain-containing protein [Candidatus Promineifilaceae bacterium]